MDGLALGSLRLLVWTRWALPTYIVNPAHQFLSPYTSISWLSKRALHVRLVVVDMKSVKEQSAARMWWLYSGLPKSSSPVQCIVLGASKPAAKHYVAISSIVLLFTQALSFCSPGNRLLILISLLKGSSSMGKHTLTTLYHVKLLVLIKCTNCTHMIYSSLYVTMWNTLRCVLFALPPVAMWRMGYQKLMQYRMLFCWLE